MNNWIHRGCLLLMASSTSIPALYSHNYLYGFITYKSFIFRILVGCLLFGCIYLYQTDRKFIKSYKNTPHFLSLWGIFLAYLTLTTFTGIDPERSFWSSFERMDGLIGLVWMIMYLISISFLLQGRRWIYLFSLSIFVAAALAMLSLKHYPEWMTSTGRLFLTFGNPAFAAVYYGFHLYFVGFLASQLSSMFIAWRNLIFAGALILSLLFFFVLVQTAARSVMLLVCIPYLLVGVYYGLMRNRKRFFYLWTPLVSLVISLFLAFGWYFYGQSIYQNFFATRSTFQARLDTWLFAWEGLKQRPWLGWGLENFGYAMTPSFHFFKHSDEFWYDRTHNVFLEWGIAAGWPGMIVFTSFFVFLLYRIYRHSTSLRQPGMPFIVGAVVFYVLVHLVNPDTLTSSICLVWILLYLDQQLPPVSIWYKFSFSTTKKLHFGLVFFLISFIIAMIYCSVWIPARTNLAMLHYLQSSQPRYVSQGLRRLYNATHQGQYEIAEQLALMAPLVEKSVASKDEKNVFLKITHEVLENQYKKRPQFMRLLDVFGTFIMQTQTSNSIKRGVIIFHNMAMQMPLRTETIGKYGESLRVIGNNSRAEKVLRSAIVQDRRAFSLRLSLAKIEMVTGDTMSFREILEVLPIEYVAEHFDELRSQGSAASLKILLRFIAKHLLPQHSKPMPPMFYFQWAQSAFDSDDRFTAKAALYQYYVFYGRNPMVFKLREDVDHGIRPPLAQIEQ